MDIYSKYHVSRVINASGKMTILGGSRVQDKVIEQCGICLLYTSTGKNEQDKINDLNILYHETIYQATQSQ